MCLPCGWRMKRSDKKPNKGRSEWRCANNLMENMDERSHTYIYFWTIHTFFVSYAQKIATMHKVFFISLLACYRLNPFKVYECHQKFFPKVQLYKTHLCLSKENCVQKSHSHFVFLPVLCIFVQQYPKIHFRSCFCVSSFLCSLSTSIIQAWLVCKLMDSSVTYWWSSRRCSKSEILLKD